MRPVRNARVGGLVETTPVTTQPEIRYEALDYITLLILRPAWAYRAELTIALLTTLAWIGLTTTGLHPRVAAAIVLVGLAVLVLVSHTRRPLVELLHRAHLRRAWDRACRHAELATQNDRVPVIKSWREVPAGELVRVRLPAGAQAPDLEEAAERIAAYLGVRDVRVTRDPDNARYADVVIAQRDPLAVPLAEPWPRLAAPALSLWDDIPVGVDEDGEPVTVRLIERNLLVGGEPGGGKSVGASMPVATAALDRDARLMLLDGKWVELACWRESADVFVGPDVPRAIKVLTELRTEMDRRYQWLLASNRRKLARGDGLPLWVVVIDELALYLNTGDRNQDRAFAAVLLDLVARGRAAGIIVIAATQKPAGNVIPTEIRDLFGFRWAFRCSTPHASDQVLGAGWAFNGASASSIDPAHRGVGYLLAEGGLPVRMRTYYLTDAHLAELADRAARLRRSLPEPEPERGLVQGQVRRLDQHPADPDSTEPGKEVA